MKLCIERIIMKIKLNFARATFSVLIVILTLSIASCSIKGVNSNMSNDRKVTLDLFSLERDVEKLDGSEIISVDSIKNKMYDVKYEYSILSGSLDVYLTDST